MSQEFPAPWHFPAASWKRPRSRLSRQSWQLWDLVATPNKTSNHNLSRMKIFWSKNRITKCLMINLVNLFAIHHNTINQKIMLYSRRISNNLGCNWLLCSIGEIGLLEAPSPMPSPWRVGHITTNYQAPNICPHHNAKACQTNVNPFTIK